MSGDCDRTDELVERVRSAHATRTPLRIHGGDTKHFYGRAVDAEPLCIAHHAGIVNYDPAELVITARAGTPLRAIEAALAAHGQRLPFEPPYFGGAATIGGAVAAGLAGPARATAGPVRDFILGVRVLAGDGRVLRFGGEVMKNVAGYDLSRLTAGSLGILGVLLEVSLKVLPRPPAQRTLVLELDQGAAMRRMNEAARAGLPCSASNWHDGRWFVRLDGAERTLDAIARRVGGSTLQDADAFWARVRELELPVLAAARSLWRLHLPPQVPPLSLSTAPVIDWGGAQRWYADVAAEAVRCAAAASGGHATWFRGAPADAEVFAPLPEPVMRIHRSLKRILDPACILNPGRMYVSL